MPSNMTNDERIQKARRHLDSLEAWLRRIIHHQFTNADPTNNYLGANGPIKKEIRDRAQTRMNENPSRFPRTIDATTLTDLVSILCNPEFFKLHFKEPLKVAFPDGNVEARTFLKRLEDIRNHLSHGGVCSNRQLERSVCYSNDIIESLIHYFGNIGMQNTYNVPSIIRFVDNSGNTTTLEGLSENPSTRHVDWRVSGNGDLSEGTTLVAEIEVDPSFNQNDYKVTWQVFGGEVGEGTVATVLLKPHHVGEQFEISFTVVTNRDWHRFFGCDDRLNLLYKVLPPPH